MSIWVNKSLRGISTATLLSVLTACAAGPDLHPSLTAAGSQLPPPNKPVQPMLFAASGQLPEDWWTGLDNPPLNALVQSGFDHSPTLETALATLKESQGDRRAGAGLFLTGADLAPAASNPLSAQGESNRAGLDTAFTLFTPWGVIAYRLDARDNGLGAALPQHGNIDDQNPNVRGARLILASNIVNAVIARAAYFAEMQTVQDLIDQEQQQLDLVEAQPTAGAVPATTLALRAQIEKDRASLRALGQRYDRTQLLLASLTGTSPDDFTAPQFCLAELQPPGDIPASLPSELTKRRPDIQAAWAALQTAGIETGVSAADTFPSIVLDEAYGTADADTPSPFSEPSLSSSASTAPAPYRETVLAAFQQVADQLRAIAHDREALAGGLKARAGATDALKLVSINYSAGLVPYSDVLAAAAALARARMAVIEATAAESQDTVALFVAVGGGIRAK